MAWVTIAVLKTLIDTNRFYRRTRWQKKSVISPTLLKIYKQGKSRIIISAFCVFSYDCQKIRAIS